MTGEAMEKKRYFGPDLVRTVACLFVLGVHFYLYTGFYDRPYQGTAMMISVPIRMALMTCVPLFMMLSGYLCVGKKWSAAYYRGFIPLLLSYGLCGIACVIFMHFNEGIPAGPLSIARRLLDFTAVPYGWYVEMYLGLFILIPFINVGWNSLPRGGKKATLIALVILGIVPNVTNYTYQIFPDFWLALYPIAYYAAGAWIKENPPKMKGIWLVAGWIVLSLAVCPLQYHLFKEANFTFSPTNYFYSLFVFGSTYCLFAALVRVKGEKIPPALKWCVSRIARLSFCIYMLSYIGDALIYPRLCALIPQFENILIWHIPAVVVNLVLSALLAWAIEAVSGMIMKLFALCENKFTKKRIKASGE